MQRRKLGVFFIALFLLLSFPTAAAASSVKKVLGQNTNKKDLSKVTMAPTVEGAGIILPDSPLFFLDTVKQDIRLLLALTPEQKAAVHMAVAGERVAELRFMLARNNKKGVQLALDGISDNVKNAVDTLPEVKKRGDDVSPLAKDINDSIKKKQQILDAIGMQTTGDLKLRIDSVNLSLFETKITAEDFLKKADLENEIADDIQWYIEHEVAHTQNAASSIEAQLLELQRETNDAAKKDLATREKALNDAIAKKNTEKILSERLKLQERQEEHDKEFQLQKDAADAARATIENAKATEEKLRKMQEAQQQLTSSSEVTN